MRCQIPYPNEIGTTSQCHRDATYRVVGRGDDTQPFLFNVCFKHASAISEHGRVDGYGKVEVVYGAMSDED